MLLAYILQPVVPLCISWVPSVVVIVVAIIITMIIILPIVLIVVTVVVVVAIVVIAAVVVVALVVFVAVVIVLPITVVISISFAGTGSLGVYRSWSNSSSRLLRSLWLNLSDSYGIAVEQVIFAQF